MGQFEEIIAGGKQVADELFAQATAPKIDQMVGSEFNGCNLFAMSKVLGIRKFRKGFWQNPDQSAWGYNIPIERNPDHGPWIAKPSEQAPKHFGFYKIDPVESARERAYPDSVLLDYGLGNNPLWDGSWVLRDYIRQPFADNPDILLGLAYVALGPIRIKSNYFVLERHGPVTYQGPRRLIAKAE